MILLILMALIAGGIGADDGDVVRLLGERAGQVETMTCDFVQTKRMSLLADELVSHGTMSFSRPGKLRWEYTRPYSYRFVFDGDRVFIGNDSRSNVMDAGSSKIFGTIARVMMNTVTGRVDKLGADFVVSVSGSAPSRVIMLTPKKREMKQLLKQVELTLDEKAGIVTHVRLSEKNGDVTDIALTGIKLNQPVDATLFTVP